MVNDQESCLVGYGSHGRDIHVIAQRAGRQLAITDDDGVRAPKPTGIEIIKGVLFGVNLPETRKRMSHGLVPAAVPLIDPSAIVNPASQIGRGCVIAPNAILLADVTLGQHVHVNYGATMTRCSVGDFSTIAPGVTICGDVTIGEACMISAGATICNLVKIGAEATIAAGAVVIHDVPAGATVRGVPAT